jgi:hypothetical protein
MDMTEELETRFTYHAPRLDQTQRYELIRNKAKEYAELLVEWCPESRELSLALTNLDEVVMFANAAIARRS